MAKISAFCVAAVLLQLAWMCQGERKRYDYYSAIKQRENPNCQQEGQGACVEFMMNFCQRVSYNQNCYSTREWCTEHQYQLMKEVACMTDSQLRGLNELTRLYQNVTGTSCYKEDIVPCVKNHPKSIALSEFCVLFNEAKDCFITAGNSAKCKEVGFKYETFRRLACEDHEGSSDRANQDISSSSSSSSSNQDSSSRNQDSSRRNQDSSSSPMQLSPLMAMFVFGKIFLVN